MRSATDVAGIPSEVVGGTWTVHVEARCRYATPAVALAGPPERLLNPVTFVMLPVHVVDADGSTHSPKIALRAVLLPFLPSPNTAIYDMRSHACGTRDVRTIDRRHAIAQGCMQRVE